MVMNDLACTILAYKIAHSLTSNARLKDLASEPCVRSLNSSPFGQDTHVI